MSEKLKPIKIVKFIFMLCVTAVLSYWILGEIFMPAENRVEESAFYPFSDGWVWIKDDGTREEIQIPGKCPAERNELIVVENTLPENVDDNLYLCIRSSKQEMNVYIDNALRYTYSTSETRLFGKVSAVAWVFIELNSEDAGKIIRIEEQTDSSYSGVFHDIFYGEKWDVWLYFWDIYGIELLISIFMMILSVASIIISVSLRITYKKNFDIEYLGWAVFLSSVWILANSVFRQILFPSISVISDMAFFMVMLLPIPFMFYMNSVQQRRYEKAYIIATILDLLDFFVCTGLHIFNIVDFTDTIKYMAIFCVISISLLAITLVIDIFTGHIKKYRLVALGIFVTCIMAVVQLVIYFTWTNQFSGSFIAIGLVVILIIAFVNTMKDILHTEKEKQKAVLSNESKSKFLANMSHEIRTPINAVLGMDAMILRESTDESIKEYALNIQNAGQTLLALINDILDFSKIESGKMELVPVEYDFSSMIHDAVNMIMMKAENKGLKTVVSVENTIPSRLFGDEGRIRQILINLLNNAVKYTKEGSVSLNVSGDIQDNEVCLTFVVEDTGVGIKEEDISKLFARFERIEEEKNQNIEGTGLGISITMQLLKLMDSELKVESEYGKGSRFSFVLKQWIVNNEPIGNLEERIKQHASDYHYRVSFTAPDAHVLIVDDNTINRTVFINLLKQTRIQIDEAKSGMECLEKVQEKQYDLIFLDHMMPELDGIETLHRMKSLDAYPCKDAPVVALTANAISGAHEMYLREGFTEYLSKPIQPEKLEKMIVSMLPKELVEEYETFDSADADVNSEQLSLPDIEGIDWNIALQHASGLENLKENLFVLYTTMDSDADELEKYYTKIQNHDETSMRSYCIKVHAMKSSAALIGAMELSQSAKELEDASKKNQTDMIVSNTPAFLKDWRSYKEKLAMCIETKEKTPVKDITEILNLLQGLTDAMDNLDIDAADSIMNQLRQYQYDAEVQEEMEKLSVYVVNLDADQAQDTIDTLMNKL